MGHNRNTIRDVLQKPPAGRTIFISHIITGIDKWSKFDQKYNIILVLRFIIQLKNEHKTLICFLFKL